MKFDLKMEKMSQKALERKSNKPIMEKKRRARINHCLNQLKALILETDNERSRHSKLEKADILEMTVRYLQTLRAYHLHIQQQQHTPLPAGGNHLLNHFQPQQQQQQQQQQAALQQQQQQLAKLQLQLQLQAATQSQQSASPPQISPTWRPW